MTLVRLTPNQFLTLAVEGDVRLGGKDWDDRIVNHVAEQFKAHHGEDPRTDDLSLTNLQAAAERAKRTLSKLSHTNITCTHAGRVLAVPLTRTDFENLTRDLLIRTRLTSQQLLRQAGLTWDKVDSVLMVGGSTHMPMTRQMLADLTGRPPDNTLAVKVGSRGACTTPPCTPALPPRMLRRRRTSSQPRSTCSVRSSRSTSTRTVSASR